MKNDYINTKTVIIGAGVSGISTAINLLKNDYSDFLIYEAMDRYGGRCHSVNYKDSFIEFGAQFIHGQVNNPIFYIARENEQIEEQDKKINLNQTDSDNDSNAINIEFDPLGIGRNEFKYHFASHDGQKIDLKLANEIYQISNKAVRLAEEFSDENDPLFKDISVADYMLEKYNELIEERFGNELKSDTNNKLKNLIDGVFVWRCKCENVENGCDSMFKVSLNNFNTFEELKGSQIIQTKYGYKKILDLIIDKFRHEFTSRLHLNHSLRKILICKHLGKRLLSSKTQSKCSHCLYTNKPEKIVLLLTDLSNKAQPKNLIVLCDHIVCTMSLGFLKKNIEKVIEPSCFIPNEKLLAISRLGFGAINKIFLVYDEKFWHDELVGIYPINLLDKNDTVFSKLSHFNESNWFENICYFEPGKDNKNVLCAWISGCEFYEKFPDEKIIKDCTNYLRQILSRHDIPEPKSILRSFWGSNPYFNGSYSYLPLESYPVDFKNLGNPICFNNKPLVMFAGEATIRKYYSTVHGAYISGEREAQRILKFRAYNQTLNY